MTEFTGISKAAKRQQIEADTTIPSRSKITPEPKSANICVKVRPSEREFFLEKSKLKRRSMASVMYEALVAAYGQPDDA